ncbi:uncharacterized protein Dana_GF12046 [Drosophila ananassae]|uniref:Uncharacterized protein n=1 Tax=Drosophila ananassae TaxID=7217 RepID=B3MCP4_DROAN|nr:uncharacterized protein LOC6494904 [Drosophila ananassae]EDV36278.1 uncharacterized protein Dana_GF12046 [Drosophila ananassae]
MSKFHTLWGALLNHFLFVVRLIANMSSPIYEQYRCASWKPKKVQDKKETTKHESRRTGAEELLMPNLQPEPLATMMSFQLMAMDVVTQMQTALHKCVNAAQSPPKMPGLEAFQRSPCYFFIDLHPQARHPFKEAAEEVSSSQLSSDKNNNGSPAKAPLNRQRSISECSEDSFICFAEDDDENDDEDDDEEAGESDGEDDDDDDSSVQFTACCDDDDPAVIDPCECPKSDSSSAAKKVRFNLKPEVHVMHVWDFAYRTARKSEWQLIARDRDRFEKRINRVAPILNPILSPNHRDSVYRARFLTENADED